MQWGLGNLPMVFESSLTRYILTLSPTFKGVEKAAWRGPDPGATSMSASRVSSLPVRNTRRLSDPRSITNSNAPVGSSETACACGASCLFQTQPPSAWRRSLPDAPTFKLRGAALTCPGWARCRQT